MLLAVRDRKFKEMGIGPGGCRNEFECEAYCDSIDHMDECISFAEENGLLSAAELAEAKKIQAAKNRGVKMPACGSKKSGDAYCSEPAHMEECITFAQEAGFMDPKDAEMARKTKGKGPGGCKTKEECESFCDNPAHQETCFNFAKEHGLISEEEIQKMEEGRQ